MNHKRLLVGMCSWNNPTLLKICVDSILKSLDLSKDGIAVVLNESDLESINYLLLKKIPFVSLPENRGVLAIDYLIPFIQNSDYFMNTNDDMVFQEGFAEEVVSVMEKNQPCSVSLGLVENFYSGNGCVVVDESLNDFYSEEVRESFSKKAKEGTYNTNSKIVAYMHPICVKSIDYLMVGGYSGYWDMDFFSGYARDDMFAFLLKSLHSDFKFIGLDKFHVFHASSASMKRLDWSVRQKHNLDIFQAKTGMSLQDFRRVISIHSRYLDGFIL